MSDLRQQLEELRSAGGGPPGLAEARKTFIAVAEDVSRSALEVGERAPDFALPDALGREIQLDRSLPAVVQFYRGGWCPYCNLQLRAYQRALGEIQALGATLVAISPQVPDGSLSVVEKNELEFAVLSDADLATARAYRIVVPLPEELIEVYTNAGRILPELHGTTGWELPIAATFVVDRDQVIRYAVVNPDHTYRADIDEVLAALRAL